MAYEITEAPPSTVTATAGSARTIAANAETIATRIGSLELELGVPTKELDSDGAGARVVRVAPLVRAARSVFSKDVAAARYRTNAVDECAARSR